MEQTSTVLWVEGSEIFIDSSNLYDHRRSRVEPIKLDDNIATPLLAPCKPHRPNVHDSQAREKWQYSKVRLPESAIFEPSPSPNNTPFLSLFLHQQTSSTYNQPNNIPKLFKTLVSHQNLLLLTSIYPATPPSTNPLQILLS
ncbi:putative fatty acid synthase subunit TOXC [Fusarium oxysporum f. sp. albedinis]|nr:putative fatty acid synthase subunit TOXC [Fusarium oxysporum f. sp. albedinis]